MVAYCSIASDVRASLLTGSPGCPTVEESAFDLTICRIIQWQENLPEKIRFHGCEDFFDPSKEKRGDYKLRLLLYLRANQMKTIVLRKSSTRYGPKNFNRSTVFKMARIAQDTIHVLLKVADKTDIYHIQHKTFNHFLETAISSVLLVLCWVEPAQSIFCLEDLVLAMDLVHQLSEQSPVSRRLRHRLQSIQNAIVEIRSRMNGKDLSPFGNILANEDAIPDTSQSQPSHSASTEGAIMDDAPLTSPDLLPSSIRPSSGLQALEQYLEALPVPFYPVDPLTTQWLGNASTASGGFASISSRDVYGSFMDYGNFPF